MRSILTVLGLGGVYLLVSGWPEGWHAAPRVALAVLLLGAVVLGWSLFEKKPGGDRTPIRGQSRVTLVRWMAVGLMFGACFWLWLSKAPDALEEGAARISEWVFAEAPKAEKDSGGGEKKARGAHAFAPRDGRRELPSELDLGGMSNRPEVFVVPKRGPGALMGRTLYVHGFAMGMFDGAAWSAEISKTLQP